MATTSEPERKRSKVLGLAAGAAVAAAGIAITLVGGILGTRSSRRST